MMDTDKNGNLSFEELKNGLNKFVQPLGDPDVQLLLDAVSRLFFIFLFPFLSLLFGLWGEGIQWGW